MGEIILGYRTAVKQTLDSKEI